MPATPTETQYFGVLAQKWRFSLFFFLAFGVISCRYEKKKVPLQREKTAPQPWG